MGEQGDLIYDDEDPDEQGFDPDPDLLLARIRWLVRAWIMQSDGLTQAQVASLVASADGLDEILSNGGPWPLSWANSRPTPRLRTIEDLPPL